MGGACNTCGRDEKFLQNRKYTYNLKEGDNLRDLNVDGQIIKTYLKRERYELMMCSALARYEQIWQQEFR